MNKRHPSFPKIKKLLKPGVRAAIFIHINPEGDCLGSALALSEILGRFGLKVQVFSQDPVPACYKFLSGWQKVSHRVPDTPLELAFVVDCGNLSRTGIFEGHIKKAPLIVNIDHHGDNNHFGQINYVETLAATGEQIFHLALFLGIKLTRSMAEALYAAVSTDTGGFRFPNTTAATLEIAGSLVRSGARLTLINQEIFENKTIRFFKALGLVMSRAKLAQKDRLVYSFMSYQDIKDLKIKDDELNELVDYFKMLGGLEVILLFREIRPGLIKINFRSRNRFNVQELAKLFGGGGHRLAAGSQFKGRLPDVVRKVVAAASRKLGRP
jgi:bifunctional oligoribonuclease and PAP phosphatase NrnA